MVALLVGPVEDGAVERLHAHVQIALRPEGGQQFVVRLGILHSGLVIGVVPVAAALNDSGGRPRGEVRGESAQERRGGVFGAAVSVGPGAVETAGAGAGVPAAA